MGWESNLGLCKLDKHSSTVRERAVASALTFLLLIKAFFFYKKHHMFILENLENRDKGKHKSVMQSLDGHYSHEMHVFQSS